MRWLVDNALSPALADLDSIRKFLEEGSLVVIEENRIRIHSLPI